MNLNQSHSIISDISVHREEILYKRSYFRQEVQLEFREQSQLFLQSVSLQTNPHFHHILDDYAIKSTHNNRLLFQRQGESINSDHGDFIKKIQRFLEGYAVLIVCQPDTCEKPLQELTSRVLAVDARIGASRQLKNSQQQANILIIYCPKSCLKAIENKVKEYATGRRDKLLFSLNSFLNKNIHPRFIKPFIIKIQELYSEQLMSLCRSAYNTRKQVELTILSVNTAMVDAECWTSEWLREEKKGIYGLQFDVYGHDHQFVRFYSLVQAFFSNLSYTVKQREQIGFYHNDVPSLLQRCNLKAVILSKKIVIFNPPDNLESIIRKLNSRQWKLTPKDFLNFDFLVFSQYKRQYLHKLRDKNGLIFAGMRVEPDLIQFQSDEHAYNCIKHMSRQFLLEMKGEEKLVPFLTSSHDLQIINKYYQQSATCQLVWINNSAFLRCCRRDMDDHYNKIREFYRQSRKETLVAMSSTPITHQLVKCTPVTLKYSYFPTRTYKFEDMCLTLRPIGEVEQEKCVLFIVNVGDQNLEVQRMLLKNQISKKYTQYDMQEVLTQLQPIMESIYIIKMHGKDRAALSHKLNRILESFIARKIPIRISLPQYSNQIYQFIIKSVTEHIIFRRSAMQHKDITFFLPLFDHEGILKIDKMIQASSFSKFCTYFLSQKQIIQGNALNLVRVDVRRKGQPISCTSLNSFIVKSELQSKKGTNFRIGIFVPQIKCKEYLVFLPTGEFFQVTRLKVERTEVKSHMLRRTAEIMRRQFKDQNYAVLYFNEEQKKYPLSIYVYCSEEGLGKRKLNMELERVEERKEAVQLEVSCKREERFELQTHKQFKDGLMALVEGG